MFAKYIDKVKFVYRVSYDIHTVRKPSGFFTVECDKIRNQTNDFFSERKLKKFLKNWSDTDHCNVLYERIENFKVDVYCLNRINDMVEEYLPMNIVFGNGTKEDTPFTTVYKCKE